MLKYLLLIQNQGRLKINSNAVYTKNVVFPRILQAAKIIDSDLPLKTANIINKENEPLQYIHYDTYNECESDVDESDEEWIGGTINKSQYLYECNQDPDLYDD